KQAFGNNVPLVVKPVIVKGYIGWYATFSDGTAVTYRPAGAASFRTSDSMATVEIKRDSINSLNGTNVLKLKFPKE
ncbi:hypothetical protein, partial [Acetobacter fabarum]|uniref:hypothetical protein n=1 Tax=Acetobacter fabarum TaxID=483199 RepID=UPI001C52AC36